MTSYRTLHSALFVMLMTLVPMHLSLAADGLLADAQQIDPHSREFFLLQAFHTNNRRSLNHLGLIAAHREEGYRVSAVLDGFPAQLAGLRRGDLLINIDGAPYHPVLSLNPQFGDGAPARATGAEIELQYSRDGSTSTIAMQPAFGNLFDAYRTATLNSAQQFSNGNKLIGYVKLWSLDRSTNGIQWFQQLLDSLAHCDGLILDLRDSYGFIDANHIDRFFSSRSSLFELTGENFDLWQRLQPKRSSAPTYGRAMAVIQNKGTRGGLELFGYQLAKLQRVVSIGETTAGKAGQVSYNEEIDLLTYRPENGLLIDGRQLEVNGIEAETPIPYPLDQSLATDPQLDAAVLALMEII